jgi:hypothetical protein
LYVLKTRDRRAWSTSGVGLGLAAVAALLLLSSSRFAARGNARRCYADLAAQVWQRTGSRRLLVFHLGDSVSGVFPFHADRAVKGFERARDPEGTAFLAALGSPLTDIALAHEEGLRLLLDGLEPSARCEFVIEWTGARAADPRTRYVLFRRRSPVDPEEERR